MMLMIIRYNIKKTSCFYKSFIKNSKAVDDFNDLLLENAISWWFWWSLNGKSNFVTGS